MAFVNLVNELQMAWQYTLEQRHRPAFESFRQQGAIGIGAGRNGDLPVLVPRNILQIDQNAHQLGYGDARMGVIELNGGMVGQRVDPAVRTAVTFYEILERGGYEEIFLAQAQLAPGWCLIAGIEDLGDCLCSRLLG